MDLRMRSPSYNGGNDKSKYLKSEQMAIKRQTSIDKDSNEQNNYTTPFTMQNNLPPQSQNSYEPRTPIPTRNYPPVSKHVLEPPREELAKDRRAMSSEKFYTGHHKEEPKPELHMAERPKKSFEEKLLILSGEISFKECVNILHYGRLIFKFLLTLKVSEYCNDNELFRLSKWLMELLAEINFKLEKKEIIYEGDNASLREQKLK